MDGLALVTGPAGRFLTMRLTCSAARGRGCALGSCRTGTQEASHEGAHPSAVRAFDLAEVAADREALGQGEHNRGSRSRCVPIRRSANPPPCAAGAADRALRSRAGCARDGRFPRRSPPGRRRAPHANRPIAALCVAPAARRPAARPPWRAASTSAAVRRAETAPAEWRGNIRRRRRSAVGSSMSKPYMRLAARPNIARSRVSSIMTRRSVSPRSTLLSRPLCRELAPAGAAAPRIRAGSSNIGDKSSSGRPASVRIVLRRGAALARACGG